MTELHSKTRCIGECCLNFQIAHGLSQRSLLVTAFNALDAVEAAEAELLILERDYPDDMRTKRERARSEIQRRNAHDNARIASMLRPVVGEPRTKVSIRNKAWFTDEDHVYTCVHFVEGNCTAYEERPLMCSDYPYGKTCEHGEACGWEEGATITALVTDKRRREERAAVERDTPRLNICTDGMLVSIGFKNPSRADLRREGWRKFKCVERLAISPVEWAD